MNENKTNKHMHSKLGTLILSVILAVVVWVIVAYLNDPETTVTVSNIEPRFVGEEILRDRGLAVINKSSIPPLSVVISGRRSNLIEYLDKLHIEFDVSDIGAEGEYSLTGTTSLPSTSIAVEKEKYDEVTVNVEAVEEKEIPIELTQTGANKNYYVKSELAHDTVVISGAKSEIKNVHMGAAEIDISMIKQSGTIMTPYLLMDENGSLIDKNETIETHTSEIPVRNVLYMKKTLPIKLRLSPEMDAGYILNEAKSAVSDTSVEVGALSENHDACVYAEITAPSDEPSEYELIEGEGMYIPANKKKIKVRPYLTEKQPPVSPPADEMPIENGTADSEQQEG